MVSIWGFFNMRDLVKLCTKLEMSVCGAVVRLEWSRLAIFKEVTTTVWQLMARFFVIFFYFFGRKQNQIYQNTLKNSKTKQTKQK